MIILPENESKNLLSNHLLTKRLTRLPLKKSSLIRFEESNIELFGEAAHDNTAGERVDEETDEINIEEIVIDSIIDKIAGGEAAHDNTAGDGAVPDKIVEELAVDPSVELAVLEAVERVDEEADEIIIDKIAWHR